MTGPLKRYRLFLEELTPENLPRLVDHVTPDVHFKDPFNDVVGAEALAEVFRDMFRQIPDVRFSVRQAMAEGNVGLMTWRFEGRLRDQPWIIDGASFVRFAEDGRVAEHIDYWDAASHFYERLPVIGWLLSRIRRRIAAR